MQNTTTTEATAQFTVGQTYQARSACNHECIWTFLVTRRTAKFITIEDTQTGETSRVGILADSFGGGEWARPLGNYSMCPVIRAASPTV